MNVEAYNLDSLRKLVRNLQDENRRLKELLDKADIEGGGEEICDKVHMGIWYLLDFGNFIHMYV